MSLPSNEHASKENPATANAVVETCRHFFLLTPRRTREKPSNWSDFQNIFATPWTGLWGKFEASLKYHKKKKSNHDSTSSCCVICCLTFGAHEWGKNKTSYFFHRANEFSSPLALSVHPASACHRLIGWCDVVVVSWCGRVAKMLV